METCHRFKIEAGSSAAAVQILKRVTHTPKLISLHNRAMTVPLANGGKGPVGFVFVLALLLTLTSSQFTTDCGNTYNGMTGSFSSPSSAGGCVWTITTPDTQKSILFNVSNMNFRRSSCRYTYLEVRDGLTEQGTRLAGFCGGPSQSVLSNGNSLYVRLRSSEYVPSFTASWSTVCHRNLTSETGNIQFDGTSDCTFVIDQPKGYTIKLDFTSVRCSESIEVFDGASTSFPLVEKALFCGSSPGSVISSGNALFIKYQTSSGAQGFRAVYTRVTPTCPQQKALGTEGNIASPGFPNPYPKQGTCTWVITVPRRHTVDFIFDVVALGSNTSPYLNCLRGQVDEILSFHRRRNGNEELLERICHRTSSSHTFTAAYDLDDYELIVNFTSKNSVTNRRNYFGYSTFGFNISYLVKRIPDCSSSPISGGSLTNGDSGLCYDTNEGDFATGKIQPFLVFGNFFREPDAYDNSSFPRRTLPVPIPGDIPIGNRNFRYVHIHEDGKLSFSNDGRGLTSYFSYYDCSDQQSWTFNTNPSLCAFCTYIRRPSSGMGGIFYKVHESEDDDSREKIFEPFNTLASRFKRPDTFNASLVLVVTWDRVTGPNGNAVATFQVAIGITKDEAFALVSYKDMNWQSRYGSPQIYSPNPADSTQCQQFLYSGTQASLAIDERLGNIGLKGSWMYRLGEREASLTSQCNDWYRRNLPKNATRWSRFNRLPQCPCVDEKNAVRNGAYGIWIKIGYRLRASNTDQMYCFRLSASAGRNLYPHGKECCYLGQSLVTSTLDGATATAYNPSSAVLRKRYLEEDKLGYDVCCRNKSAEDCQKYYSLRPIGTCDPAPPYKFAWLCCDPYFLTLDEVEYLFNGWGEYTLVDVTSGGRSFTLQARTDLAETETGTLTNATIFSAFGARENDVSVFVQLDPNTKAALVIYVNDDDYSRRFKDDVDFILDEEYVLLQRRNDTVQIAFQSGISFGVSLRTKSLGISVNVPKLYQNKTRGMLGNFNGIKDDDFLLPNGTILQSVPSERQIFEIFGPAWAVTVNNSVMRYGPREGPADYSHPEFMPIFMDEQTEAVRNTSRALCGKNLACLYDYIATARESIAVESKAFKENADGVNEAIKNAVPVIDPPSVVRANSGDRVTFNLMGSDPDGDTLTYYNNTHNSGVQLNTVTGDVSFLADTNTPVDLHFYVEDSKMARSPTYAVQIVVCSGCSNHGTCSSSTFQPVSDNSVTYYFQRAACVCDPAWDGDDCQLDRDGCATNPCLVGQTCTDLTPDQQGSSFIGFSCGPCPTGYTQLTGSTIDCVDVDECADSSVHGCQMTCTNTEGSYQCGCRSGYRLSSDGRSCPDVDECEEKTDNCEQVCQNDAGGYQCSCEPGYVLQSDGITCRQNATLDTACRYAGCSQGCRLATEPATGAEILQCFCFAGYDQDPLDDAACLDHDECQLDNVTCSQNCYNYDGGFACTCNSGYYLAADQVMCLPCPPLSYGPNCQYTCDCNGRGQRCDPATGCVCDEGWKGAGCQEDVNECTDTPDICGSQLLCVNTLGSYSCRCLDGYSQDSSRVCADIDECEEDSLLNTCDSLQRCVNFPGGFTCDCLPGYIASEGTCVDIDECSANTSECQQLCSNSEGSYNCDCFYGYRLNADRTTCSQVTNRCAAGDVSCDHGCSLDDEDTPFCFCNLGYSLNADGQTCDRILTCANFGCSHTCSATDTGLLCSCPADMTLDNDLKACKMLPGVETCVQFETRTPCPEGQFCVLEEAGPVCRSNKTGSETGDGNDGNGGNDENGGHDENGESSANVLLIGLSVGIPLAVIVIVAVVVSVVIFVIKPGRKRKEPVEDPYAHLSGEKEAESQYTELQHTK